jgi:hypothetical protein
MTPADPLLKLFHALCRRGEPSGRAQRHVLRCAVALFADALGLHPGWPGLDGSALEDAAPIALTLDESELLSRAAGEDWSRATPDVLGAIFQATLGGEERHARGAHFTADRELQRVVGPSLVAPWTARIAAAQTAAELRSLHAELGAFRVLDPACGSGDFLLAAFQALSQLDLAIRSRLQNEHGHGPLLSTVDPLQLLGIDVDPLAVTLARIEILIAERIRAREAPAFVPGGPGPRPLRDLEPTIVCADALFCDWPPADVVLGNPPYLPKNKAQRELGPAYLAKLRRRYPEVSGRADHCVYWFRRAHDALPPGGRAGLVGTNTIRQNASRQGGLDYVVRHGGTITEAVSTQVWPGDATLHVSIVNWIKGSAVGEKILWVQEGDRVDSPWRRHVLPAINAALSPLADVTTAEELRCNERPKTCFQGQTPGHAALVVGEEVAARWIGADPANAEVLLPYLIGDDLLDDPEGRTARRIIDFGERDLVQAGRFRLPFAHVEARVRRKREEAAAQEEARNAGVLRETPAARVNRHHQRFLARWWLPSYRREDMLAALSKLSRYIVCSRVTRRPIFELVSSQVRPSDALQVFAFDDDYSFGVLQSDVHWRWFVARCSGLKIDPRYTSETVYDTFPWPQGPTAEDLSAVAAAGRALREARHERMRALGIGLRELYRRLEGPGEATMKQLHEGLTGAVRRAYGMTDGEDPLAFLLSLNHAMARRLDAGEPVVAPGWPVALSLAPVVAVVAGIATR